MRHALATLLLLIAAGCSTPDPFTEADQQRVASEVDSMLHAYHDAMREGGLLTEFDYLDSTDAFFWVPPGYESWLSFDSVETILRANAPTLRSTDYQWEVLRIDPVSNDHAIFTGTIRGTLTDTSGQITNIGIIETGTVVRRDDGWKLLNGQSAVLPVDE